MVRCETITHYITLSIGYTLRYCPLDLLQSYYALGSVLLPE